MASSLPSIRIEGGLLGPDLLDQLVAGELSGQRPADFGLDAKRNLTDEIAAVFADARALWGVFQHRRERLPEGDPGTSVTRDAWMVPFLGLLGYEPRYNARAYEVDGMTFAVSHRASEGEDAPPIHVVGVGQELGRVPSSGRPRLAPHSLVQEFLNRTEHVWGIVTNGLILRLLRDCTLVRRQAYVEFDLTGIFEEQRFHDFAALYRLLHRTRLPRTMADGSDCLLEKYYAHSLEQGGRVRDRLRDGVEEAIQTFANGFLAHPGNEEFRAAIRAGRPAPRDLFKELLRIIYRLLFLMVSEERGLLSKDPTYNRYYSITRLRGLLDVRAAYTENDDLWLALRTVFRVLQDEKFGQILGLPALNGDLFAPIRLDCLALRNAEFLTAFWYLSNYEADGSVRRVNYAALDVSIGQGDTRAAGLAAIKRAGGTIMFARRFVKWPGRANVEVNLVGVGKDRNDPPNLDGQVVTEISSRLDAEAETEPLCLRQNDSKSFIGSYVLGMGFTMSPEQGRKIIEQDPRNRDCLFPYLNGQDLNSQREQRPTRWVINFFDWPLERAERYRELLRIVRDRVKPERDTNNREVYRLRWWIYGERRPGLYATIQPLTRVLVRSEVSENHMLSFVPNGWVYSHMLVVFAFDDYFHFALLQSNVHEAWVRRNASTMRTDIRYTPTDCFETFPFPQSPPAPARAEAERIGEEYHEHRRQLMLARQLGLTKTYNLFHNPACTDADITRLRNLHAAMDRAILTCYGWQDLDPGHGFHQNERGQTRYTISPTARRDLLRRLLELNLQIAIKQAPGDPGAFPRQLLQSRSSTAPEAAPAVVLPFRRVEKPTEAEKYKTCVPVLNLKVAAGGLGDWQNPRWDGWAEVKTDMPLRKGMFVAQVDGSSMEPLIPAGSWCLFKRPVLSIRDGMIAIVQHRDISDPETGGNYTIKRVYRVQGTTREGGVGYSEIRLEPENPSYGAITIRETDDANVQPLGEFLEVLR
jgi:SOS-response transcriptional repressor LexA